MHILVEVYIRIFDSVRRGNKITRILIFSSFIFLCLHKRMHSYPQNNFHWAWYTCSSVLPVSWNVPGSLQKLDDLQYSRRHSIPSVLQIVMAVSVFNGSFSFGSIDKWSQFGLPEERFSSSKTLNAVRARAYCHGESRQTICSRFGPRTS